MSGTRLERTPRVVINRRDAHIHGASVAAAQIGEHVCITHDHWSFGHKADWRVPRDERFKGSTGEFVMAFDRLVGVGGSPDGDLFANPRWFVELSAQNL